MRTEDMWITMTFIQLAEAVLDPQLMPEHPYGELPVCCVHELSNPPLVCNESWATVIPIPSPELKVSLPVTTTLFHPNPKAPSLPN